MNDKSFIGRLEQIKGKSARDFALRAGIKPTTMTGYFNGAEPTRPNLVAMAAAAGVSVHWLATGEGPMRPVEAPTPWVDPGLFGRVCEGVSRAYEEAERPITAEQLGIIAAQRFNELLDAEDTPARLIQFGQALERLRLELRGTPVPADASGKRRA